VETIFSLSTPRGKGAVAIIRLSGPHSGPALAALAGPLPPPRQAALRVLREPSTAEPLDRALVIWFPGPRSFSGEDMAELQAHGGPAVIAALLAALAALPGLRPAEPGEFTRRAFLNGRLDLTAAEGLADLIAAETAGQRRQALRQLDGALDGLVERWRSSLTTLMAHLEAEIDFPDEGLELERAPDTARPLKALRDEIARHLSQSARGERLREGYRVALVGAPNAGKSSLLNALAKREVAIVTDEPGTTRDVLELHLDLGGYPVILADMAGLRPKAGGIEAIGIARAKARAAEAELRLLLVDVPPPQGLDALIEPMRQPGDLILRSKSDIQPKVLPGELSVSALTGEGLPRLLSEIEARAVACLGGQEAAVFTRLRHRTALAETLPALGRALVQWDAAPPELVAEDLRLAARALGRITGRIDVEDILDVVFAEFCIGK
jgi:tRNA modification GTPase